MVRVSVRVRVKVKVKVRVRVRVRVGVRLRLLPLRRLRLELGRVLLAQRTQPLQRREAHLGDIGRCREMWGDVGEI
jgi:hypothetical protein